MNGNPSRKRQRGAGQLLRNEGCEAFIGILSPGKSGKPCMFGVDFPNAVVVHKNQFFRKVRGVSERSYQERVQRNY